MSFQVLRSCLKQSLFGHFHAFNVSLPLCEATGVYKLNTKHYCCLYGAKPRYLEASSLGEQTKGLSEACGPKKLAERTCLAVGTLASLWSVMDLDLLFADINEWPLLLEHVHLLSELTTALHRCCPSSFYFVFGSIPLTHFIAIAVHTQRTRPFPSFYIDLPRALPRERRDCRVGQSI